MAENRVEEVLESLSSRKAENRPLTYGSISPLGRICFGSPYQSHLLPQRFTLPPFGHSHGSGVNHGIFYKKRLDVLGECVCRIDGVEPVGDIAKMWIKFVAWESQTPDTLHFEDLDEKKIRGCVMYGISQGRMPESSSTEDTMTLLEKFAMVEKGKIKNAAAALFTKRPQSYPQFTLRMARLRGKDKMVFIDNMRAEGNYFDLLDAGMAFLFKHLNLSGVVKGFRREERLEIPAEALREALTNALCHRLLDSPSGSVGIAVYDDRVENENTGLFVWITFKRPSSVGNTNDGKGDNSVDSPVDSPIDSPVDSPIDSPNNIRISSEVVDKIYSLIKEKQTISADELAKVTGKSVRTIRKGIRILKEKGRIKRVDSPTVGGKWEIIEKQE